MQHPSFSDRLASAVRQIGSPVCVGIDPHTERLDPSLGSGATAARAFGLGVVDAVAGVVPVVKPQVAFFEQHGAEGVAALEAIVAHAQAKGLVVVLDAKRGDIGSTAKAYARATAFADAVTLSPYLGPESMTPYLDGRGVFVLVRTSNPGAGAWQTETGTANRVATWVEAQCTANLGACGLGDVGAVIGATVPEEAAKWRAAMPHAWLLVPGFGAQGGTTETVRALFRGDGMGALVVSARGVLFPKVGFDGPNWQDAVHRRATELADAFSSLLD